MATVVIDDSNLLSIEEACTALGISYATIFRWAKSGKIALAKYGDRTLVSKQEVERVKSKQKQSD